MSKINEILTGWANLISSNFNQLNTEIKSLSEKRLNICDSCNIRLGSICNPRKVGRNVETGQLQKGCGCNIAAKSMSPKSKCPLGKW